ncbi:winged helix-turn-helix domain-containing protein [Amycolatopsis sp. NPDC049868]|uniref:response regulator transcription factor n=1 Tax=Amycolatopsis sp. NPDC049868 TaxID=3363934 RepID=UPI0037BB7695
MSLNGVPWGRNHGFIEFTLLAAIGPGLLSIIIGLMDMILVLSDSSGTVGRAASVLQSTYLIDRAGSLGDARFAVRDGQHAGVILNMEIASMAKVVESVKTIISVRPVPILVLTVQQNEADVVRIFQSGADECLPPTVTGAELLARTKAMIRRHGNRRPTDIETEADIVVGSLRISPAAREATLDGRPLGLASREFDLLLALARRPGHTFDRRDLQKALWGTHSYGRFNVNAYVTRLRRKLGELAEKPRFLHTVYGVGLKLHVSNSDQPGQV